MYTTFKKSNITYPRNLQKFTRNVLNELRQKASTIAASFFHHYKGDVSDFANFYLRNNQIPPQIFRGGLTCSFDVSRISEYCDHFDKILSNKKTYQQNFKKLYRGTFIEKGKHNFLQKIKGDIFTDLGYFSTSQSEKVALYFMNMNILTLNPPNQYDRILFRIGHHFSGINMLEYATSDDLRWEKEILFPSGTSFEVIDRTLAPILKPGISANYLILDIKEI